MATKKNASSKKSNPKTTKKRVSATSSAKSRTRKKTPAKKKPASRAKAKSKAAAKKQPTGLSSAQKYLIVGVTLLFTTAVLILSLLSPSQGQFTLFIDNGLGRLFGLARYVIPLVTGFVGAYLVMRGMDQQPSLPVYRMIGFGTLFLVFATFASMVVVRRNNALGDVWQAADVGQGGGYAGAALAEGLTQFLGNLGTIVTLVVFGVIGAILLSGITRKDVSGWFARITQPSEALTTIPVGDRAIRINPGRQTADGPQQLPLIDVVDKPESKPEPQTKKKTTSKKKKPVKRDVTPEPAVAAATTAAVLDSATSTEAQGYTWTLPVMGEILDSGTDLDLNSASIREQVEIIEHTLDSFGAPVTVVEINQGPTITQFGVEPNYITMRNGKRTKVKVGKIAGLADDLALALAARSIRIQAPVPGKGFVGIEVPNSAKALVSLRDVMESAEFNRVKSPLRIGLGQNVAGTPIVADLAAMPHLLVAGTTGSGKSVLVNSIIAGLLLLNTPDDLKLVMVDPKRVELTGYNGIPHLAAPVVVEMDRVIGTLQWAQREMDHRYKLFADVGARNIIDYNKKIKRRANRQKMPYIVIIVDELADLMMLAPEDTERAITRLAQMARATGIHMVIATQRPSVDVVTGLIKANFPARVAFAVASSTDSRVILDTTGAERLLGQGDMLFQSPDAAAAMRLQGCFVSDSELQTLINYWQRARRSQVINAEENAPPVRTAAELAADSAARNAASVSTPSAAASTAAVVAPPQVRMEPSVTAPTPTTETKPEARTEPKPAAEEKKETAVEAEAPSDTTPKPKKTSTSKKTSDKKTSTTDPIQQPLWEALEEMDEAGEDVALDLDDDLLPEAIAMVRQINKASTSLLQRRFRIGYTRAARMIDAMEASGIIGPPTGNSKARDVYPAEGE